MPQGAAETIGNDPVVFGQQDAHGIKPPGSLA
jgi:hypothetical protein